MTEIKVEGIPTLVVTGEETLSEFNVSSVTMLVVELENADVGATEGIPADELVEAASEIVNSMKESVVDALTDEPTV